jgi:ATP-dependent DNA helicase RecG
MEHIRAKVKVRHNYPMPRIAKPRAAPAAAPSPPPTTQLATQSAKSAPQKALNKLGLVRDIDLALHIPLRYEDETHISKLADARDGNNAQIEGEVTACEVAYRPRRQLVVTLQDGTDTCTLRFFNFYPSQQKQLAVGQRIRARGELRGGMFGWSMLHPACKSAGGALPVALTPVYSTVAGLPQPYLRRAVLSGLEHAARSGALDETLPSQLLAEKGNAPTFNLHSALSFLHYPSPDVSVAQLEDRSHPAWQRLKLEELLAQQLSQLQSKRERDALRAPVLLSSALAQKSTRTTSNSVRPELVEGITKPQSQHTAPLVDQLLAAIPFQLTAAQQRVCAEVAHDIAQPIPMHRLLQGDVGSGKTVVAALAAAVCIGAGYQCALMAPTEILAEQHFRKLIGWLEPLGIQVAWLTGSQKTKERREMLALIASGAAGLVVGTHAVIQDKVQFHNLALAIIDEQHRFGVKQRLALREKMNLSTLEAHNLEVNTVTTQVNPAQAAIKNIVHGAPQLEPHLLMMTATPIPRTLAMSYYADLDVSTIDELPPGRTPIVTKVISDNRRDEVVQRIRTQIDAGRQVYWVCPLIEESEALDLTNATQTHEELSAALQGYVTVQATAQAEVSASPPSRQSSAASTARTNTPQRRPIMVGLLHSRMPPAEKKAVMALFTSGHMQVLVSTTVIEVGVDVPNASLMVIEHAERFGLSQLHQLRGRVGRGAAASACVLMYGTGDSGKLGETARARLKVMAQTNDGFEIAKQDLEIRGPGEFLGARQSGAALLRFADLTTDAQLLNTARQLAPLMLDQHKELAEKHIARWLGGRVDYLNA